MSQLKSNTMRISRSMAGFAGRFSRLATIATATIAILAIHGNPAMAEVYGPVDLLKTMKTPFGNSGDNDSDSKSKFIDQDEPIGISHSESPLSRRLSDRVLQPRLYLPGSMVLGSVAEFTIKGKPGKWVVLAMADKDSGAKPVLGHDLRLGPDRRLVSIIQIPPSGIAQLLVETPIEGDLVGGNLYFEAALWSESDMSDVEFAQCIAPGDSKAKGNAVPIAGQSDPKRGLRFVPDTRPMMIRTNSGLSAGKPSDN